MNITKVRSNVKAGCDTTIGPKTLIVGPNGSGKSTIVNAIELALTSRVGDIAGRTDIAREADVLQLAPKGATAVVAEVEFDNGIAAFYRAEGSTAKAKKHTAKRPESIQHEDVLPIRTLKEALLGSPTTARKFLIAKVCGDVTRKDIENLLPEVVRETWRAASSTVPESIPAPDALVEVLEYAGKQQRDATSKAKTQREAGKLVGGGRMSPPSEAEVSAAKKARDTAKSIEQSAAIAANQEASIKSKKDAVEALKSEVQKAREAVETNRKAFEDLGKPVVVDPRIDSVLTVMQMSAQEGVCYVCEGQAPTKEFVESVSKDVAEHRSKNAKHDAADHALQNAVLQLSNLENNLEASEASLKELADSQYTGPSFEEAQAASDKAEDDLQNLRGARDAWNSVQKAESVALDCERQAAEWKALKEACEAAVGGVLDRARESFVAKVQKNLPSTDTFSLNLRDGDREVVQFGLVRDDKLHTALSGAEWARVMAAMAEACIEDGKYGCIVPEERAFDEITLFEVLKSLGTSKHQVVITSPVHPVAIPEGWTVIKR